MNDSKPSGKTKESDGLVGVPTHPAATGVGAVGGAAAGATIGLSGGPLGAVLGGVVGAVVGGLGGDAVASSIDQAQEASYWRETYATRPYVPADASFDDYGPAYAFGVGAFERHGVGGRSFDEIDDTLSSEWETQRGDSRLPWEHARHASRDAWDRLTETTRLPRE